RLCLYVQVGDQVVEINGEPTQGITHTRAIELIQAGGSKVLLLLRPGQGLVQDNSKLDPTVTSSTSFPKEALVSETSPLASPFSTCTFTSGSSSFTSETPDWNSLSPRTLHPQCSRGTGSVEWNGEWADRQADRLSPITPEQINLYKVKPGHTRSKDSKEHSSPKKTGETFSKAKEHSQSHKKSERKAQKAEPSKDSPKKSTRERQEASSQLHVKKQQVQQSTSNELSSKDPFDENKNSKRGDSKGRKNTQEREGIAGTTKAAHDQVSIEKRVGTEAGHYRPTPMETGAWRDILKVTLEKSKPRDGEKEKRKEQTSKKDIGASLKEGKTRKYYGASTTEEKSIKDTQASPNAIQQDPVSQKGQISPCPWKVPSSARILSQAEVLRNPPY
uniref:PDZ domain-containing protein n=1 Tax=Hucho hucho TaxID=62062 RepID=A0A4W5QC48_9TELE